MLGSAPAPLLTLEEIRADDAAKQKDPGKSMYTGRLAAAMSRVAAREKAAEAAARAPAAGVNGAVFVE